jgi:flavorubredoxin
MKVNIIVYSETNNTKSVVEKLKLKMEEKENDVELIELQVHDFKRNKKLTSIPKISQSDLIVFASPVQAFSLALPMVEFMSKMEMTENQKVYLLITQHFKRRWLGGNNTFRKMKKLLSKFNAKVEKEFDIHWSSKNRESQIEEAANELSQ